LEIINAPSNPLIANNQMPPSLINQTFQTKTNAQSFLNRFTA
jgi:hypothetical protein